MAAAAVLLAGCLKDGIEVPAVAEPPRLVLSIPETDEVAVTRAATAAECRINTLYVLIYRTGSLQHRQVVASGITGNGTATPSVPLNYKVQNNDVVYVVANPGATVAASLDALGTGASEGGLSALLVYDNPAYTTKSQPSGGMPMFGKLAWSAGTNTCQMARSMAKVTVSAADGLFTGKTLKYALAGAPAITSMEVTISSAGEYAIPNVVPISGPWGTDIDASDLVAPPAAHYCAPYPVSTAAGSGVTLDKNTFDSRRTALILAVEDVTGTEYYRLDFSTQTAPTAPSDDASNEYLDIAPNTHYTFDITRVRSGGYSTPQEAQDNPGSNIEYTVTVSGQEWTSATSNGQYLVKTNRERAVVTDGQSAAADLVKFTWQTPDAGQKPGDGLPGSVTTRVVTLVGADKTTPVPTSELQLCLSDGTPVPDNTLDLHDTTVPASGYQLKYTSDSSLPATAAYLRVQFGNVEHLVPVVKSTFNIEIPTTGFKYSGAAGNALRVDSYGYDPGADRYYPVEWAVEFSSDGGATWTTTNPMLPVFPGKGNGSDPDNPADYPAEYRFDVAAQTPVDLNAAREWGLKTTKSVTNYNLSNRTGGPVIQNTANCYIINAPGSYTLPLVYGNAISVTTEDSTTPGADNKNAYNSTNDGSTVLKTFVNHRNAAIIDPYIYNNPSCAPAYAASVWYDNPGSYTYAITGVKLSSDQKSIEFNVSQSNITQSNTVIAVYDSNKTVMWSWNIWITDFNPIVSHADKKFVTNYDNSYAMMPVNLGWVYTREDRYDARSVLVRFTQPETGLSKTITLDQMPFYAVEGNNPYYQWGRKDPIPAVALDQSGNLIDKFNGSSLPGTYDRFVFTFGTGSVPIGTAIQTPWVYYGSNADWCNANGTDATKTSFYNLWNTNNIYTSANDYTVLKTVYDPSPPGYCIPSSNVFNGFTYNGNSVSGASYLGSHFNSPYTSLYEIQESFLWEFYCKRMTGVGGYNDAGGTIFFPLTGKRAGASAEAGSTYGVSGDYWTAIPASSSNGRGMNITNAPLVNPLNTAATRSQALSLRPMEGN